MKFKVILSFPIIIQIVCSLKVMLHSDFGSRSHIKPLLEIATELNNRGHDIVYAAVEDNGRFLKEYENMTFISLGINEASKGLMSEASVLISSQKTKDSLPLMASLFTKLFSISYEHIYPQLERILLLERPDVIICDFFSPACRDAAEMNGIPLISGFQTTDGFGINDAKYLTHTMDYAPITTETLSFSERFQDAVIYPLRAAYHFMPMSNSINNLRSKYGVPESSSPFGDFSRTLGIANTFVGFEPAVATPPNIKQVGPIMSKNIAPLTAGLTSFLDQHKRNIYIAFGSHVMLRTIDIENIVLCCLKAIDQGSINGVIWGLGNTKRTDFPETLHYNGKILTRDGLLSHPKFQILDWAPQVSILNHPNTITFISHGGLESIFESIVSKTPILCMAFLGDQPRNAKKIELAGIGIYIDRNEINSSKMAEKITNLLNDPALPFNLERVSTIAKLNGRIEYAADLIETYANTALICRPLQPFVFGQPGCEAAHLIPVSQQMSFVKANQLDVYAIAILFPLITICLTSFIIYEIIKLTRSNLIITSHRSKSD